MPSKPKLKIKVVRNGELVDRDSTVIRSDQAAKLKQERPPTVVTNERQSKLKLVSKEPKPIYTAGKVIVCEGRCGLTSPTRRMYVYRNSTRGRVFICENCVDEVERTSFTNLDYCDEIKKKYRVEPDSR